MAPTTRSTRSSTRASAATSHPPTPPTPPKFEVHALHSKNTDSNPNPKLTLTFTLKDSTAPVAATHLSFQREVPRNSRGISQPYKISFTEDRRLRSGQAAKSTTTPTLVGRYVAIEREMEDIQEQVHKMYEEAKREGRLRDIAGRGEEEKLGALFDKVRTERMVLAEAEWKGLLEDLVAMGFLVDCCGPMDPESGNGNGNEEKIDSLARELKKAVDGLEVRGETYFDLGGFHVPAVLEGEEGASESGSGSGDHPMEM
ncbi:hypothetical protein BDW74DRAFT_179153 [Aspergillus multicolor]|uniref:uncharacterized protein n=1 Tax=Aspergillus multicolor TaxID=41759 RepID=UPI003CCCD274